MAKAMHSGRRLFLRAMQALWPLQLCTCALAAEAEYAIRWTQTQPLDDVARARLVALMKMSNLRPVETFTVRYLEVQQQPTDFRAMGDPILRVRIKHAHATGQADSDDKVETTLKYRGSEASAPGPASCPLGRDRAWKTERDITWLPPWQPQVLQAIAIERKLALDPTQEGWPQRVRQSVACDAKGDLGSSMPMDWLVVPVPCQSSMRRTEADSGLRIEEWSDASGTHPVLVEVSLKVKQDTDAAREKFTSEVALPLMAVAGVVPEIENKTELSDCHRSAN